MSSFMDEAQKDLNQKQDELICNFLNNNGYPIDSPTNLERLREISKELKAKDLYVDYIQFTLPQANINNSNEIGIRLVIYPFFNSISHPASKEFIDKITIALKEKYLKGK